MLSYICVIAEVILQHRRMHSYRFLSVICLMLHDYSQVQKAIHAPHIDWETCSSGSVYVNAQGQPGNDQSVASTLSVLPNVIEKSVRTVIVHGLAVSCMAIELVQVLTCT